MNSYFFLDYIYGQSEMGKTHEILFLLKSGGGMFLALWNYLHGYVMIRVTGFSVERFVNLAALKGIYIWDVYPDGTGINMKVSIHGFRLLKECGRKTKCRFKIIEKKGLPFALNKYKKRKILGIGIIVFVIGLYVLSSFIWVVEIEGNSRVENEKILQSCEKMGLEPGSLKFKVNTKAISDGLITEFENISWVGVKITGTNIKISIVETIPETKIVDRVTPCDIVAKKDGIIIGIATSAGTPLVKQGDVVQAGDILVSSEISIKSGDEEVGREYVKAEAVVQAKLWYELKDELELKYNEKVYSGETKKDISFVLGDKNINIVKPNIKYDNFDEVAIYEKPLAIGDYQFPVSISESEYREYHLVEKTRTVEQAKEELKAIIGKKANELLGINGSILNTEIAFDEVGTKLTAQAVVTVTERIDERKEYQNTGRDSEDGTSGESSKH